VTGADADQASVAVLNICAAQRAIVFLRIAAGLEDPKRGQGAAMAEPLTVKGP